jgi:hypothetical protein
MAFGKKSTKNRYFPRRIGKIHTALFYTALIIPFRLIGAVRGEKKSRAMKKPIDQSERIRKIAVREPEYQPVRTFQYRL